MAAKHSFAAKWPIHFRKESIYIMNIDPIQRTDRAMRARRQLLQLTCVLALCVPMVACGGSQKRETIKLADGTTATVPPKKAIEQFEKAVKSYEGSKGKNISSVKGHLEDAVSIDAKFSKAWFNLGVIQEREGKTADAKKSYAKAADTSDRFAAPHVNLGKIAMAEGNRDEAMAQFRQAVSEDDFNPEAHNNLSVLMREKKDYKEAIKHARQSLAGNANNTSAYANLALIYYTMDLNDVAKLVVLNALKIDEKNPDVWNTYGLIELKNNNVTDAIKHFQKSIKLKPDHLQALMNLGAIMLSVRDYQRSITLFEEALKYDKKNREAVISIAVAKRGMGDLKEAERLYKSILKDDSGNHLALYNLAILEHEHLAQATILGVGGDPPGEDPVAQMEWSIQNMTKALKNYESAREYYSSFLNAYKGDKHRKEAESRMAQVQNLLTVTRTQIEELKEQKEIVAEDMKVQAAQDAQDAKDAAAAKIAEDKEEKEAPKEEPK